MTELDEKEVEKEIKEQEKEEQRHLKRQKQMKKSQKKFNGKALSDETKKELLIAGIVVGAILILLVTFPFIKSAVQNAGKNNPYEGYLLMKNLTGYYEEDAIEELRKTGFVNIKRTYIYDQFTEDKCVVKANYHINSLLKPDEEIILYICDESLIASYVDEDSPNHTNQSANTTYFSMNNITIIDMAIKDGHFYCIAKNNNREAITNIAYKIGYQDVSGVSIGEYRYMLDDNLTILPGEKFTFSGEIRSTTAMYLYISGFSYTKVSVPSNQRN